MYFSKIFKVKEGKLDTIKNWFTILNTTRKEEAISTFEYEEITREVFVLFEGKDDNHYVIGFNEASRTPGPSNPNVTINREHNEIKKECLESISNPGEILMDLSI